MTQSTSDGKAHSISENIGHKVSWSSLLPDVAVSLNAQSHGGFQVIVFSPAGNEPSEVYAGLRAVGFAAREQSTPVGGSIRQSFGRDGSGLLGGWTGPERERFLADARRTLRRFGFAFVPEVAYARGSPG
jgi:hypothetical protein